MTQQATTNELKTQLLNGWLGSLVLHGLLLCSFLPLFRLSSLSVPKDPFHWNVTLVQSTLPTAEPLQDTTFNEPVVPKLTEQAPVAAHMDRTIHHAAPSTERIMPIQPHTAEPVAPTATPRVASPSASLNEPASTSILEKPAPNYPQVSDPPSQQADISAHLTTAETSTPQPIVATANETTAPPSEVALTSPSQATVSTTEAAVIPRPDYGWLQQAIFRRLEELKQSSRPSLDDSRHLKVTIKAVVSREGLLLDSAVVKSSGLDRIDQEAMTLVQRAFPMQLDRPLDRQQVAMRIPITYSRE